jgi:plastocyanin
VSSLLHRGRAGAAALALIAACHRAPPAPPTATTHVDLPPSYQFAPADIVVPSGATVVWTNHDHFTHSIHLTDDGGASMMVPPGDSVRFTFTRAGLHHYDCSLHPHDMHGTVTVAGGTLRDSTAGRISGP